MEYIPEKQVGKDAYSLEQYGGVDRFASYHYQLKEIIATRPKSVLEAGVGDRVIANYIRDNTDIEYKSLDIAEDLGPDVRGSITDIPLPDGSFDVVCAFEVLEHLSFEEFERSLREMRRVARKKVLISVPHFGPPVKFLLKVPFLPEICVAFKIPFPRRHVFNGQHYWEIGKSGYSRARIRNCIKRLFTIDREYVPFENQYHHFFILTPLKDAR